MGDLFKALFGSIAGPLFLCLGLGVLFYTLYIMNIDFIPVLSFMVALSPIWIPISLFYIFFERWQDYTGLKFQDDNGRVTLRIKPPQEVFKSPEAMESVFSQAYNSYSRDNLVQSYIDGKRPLTYSFEIAFVDGEVRFYINVPKKKVKNHIEALLYAHYPGIEVTEEVVDYTAEVRNDLDKHDFMGFHFVKKEKDEVMPIKTYIDFGMDKLPKEEEKFEPMAPLLEHIGKCKPHERIWIQWLCTPHVKQNFKNGQLQPKDTWEKAGKAKIKEMMEGERSSDPDNPFTPSKLTMGERDTIAAIERNISKYAYEVSIRAMYITLDKTKFDGDMIGPILRGMSQWDMIGRNGVGLKWRTDFDWPWFSDPKGTKKKYYKRRELDYYKGRNWVDGDAKTHADAPKVMSAEELASMYHIPGKSVITPSLSRVESIRRNAPTNLPIGTPPNSWS